MELIICGLFLANLFLIIKQHALTFHSFLAIGDIVLASAFEKYVIAIWGATSPALQVEPCMPENTKARVFE